MAFEDQIVRVPRAVDVEVGGQAAEDIGATGAARELIAGAAGTSPYISDLIRKDAEWLRAALKVTPGAAFEAVLESIDESDAASSLRRAKRRVALLAALADLGGVWSLEHVTRALTRFADAAVGVAFRAALLPELQRGKLPGQTEEDLAACGGLVSIAMGKMGAFELNYSSDIDLICLFDETRFEPDDYGDARASFVRVVRKSAKLLSERTADGYVFRTDLRLRPDASVTPVAISMEAAERYYESFGRTWERAAYIKARAAAGDVAAGERFLKALEPFVWRRHLDFWAIQDAHDMRLKIRDHKGLHGEIDPYGHDLKLGAGGIREIEFFTQTRQIIAGGRDRSLRVSTTKGGLDALAAAGWVDPGDADLLKAHYTALREAEHRVQMVGDQQTHVLPKERSEFARVAALSGVDAEAYADDLRDRMREVQSVIDRFFARERPGGAVHPVVVPEGAADVSEKWAGYPAMRSPRAVEIFDRMKPGLMTRLGDASNPSEALKNFDQFLAGLPAGVQVFSLFESNPQLLDLVVDITDTAPALAAYLARNAGVFDAVIGGDFFTTWPGCDGLRVLFADELARAVDYEGQLDTARVVAREWQFRVGVHHLRGLISADEAGRQYADIAEAIIEVLWPCVVESFAAKHGAPPGRGALIVGMGSLGVRRLTAQSDLDLIVIYDGADVESSDGRRPLATRAYYARLTQALVTAISAPTAEGRLFEVDMRLRPSGRQGPVATSLASYQSYQAEQAWTWEHLALTRARPVAGAEDLKADFEAVRLDVLGQQRDRCAVLSDVADMRARLATAKGAARVLDTKVGPGRLQDVELMAQTAALLSNGVREPHAQLAAVRDVFAASDDEMTVLRRAADLFWRVQAAGRLISEREMDVETVGAGACAFLYRETACADLAELVDHITALAAEAAEIVDKYVGPAAEVPAE